MHYYQFNLGDYASKTQHLTEMEDLAYRRMIDLYMRIESPLPLDVQEIARLTRMRSHTDCIANVLRDFFVETADGYVDADLQEIVDKFKEKSLKAKRSAQARWGKKPRQDKENDDANAYPNALQTQSEGNANQEPRTNNHKPITNKISYSPLFEKFWSKYPQKKGKAKSFEIFKKLKPDDLLVEKMTRAIDAQSLEKTQQRQTDGWAPDWKHPERWLKGRHWEDETSTQAAQPTPTRKLFGE